MSLCEWYFDLQQQYEREHGDRTVVLIMVGSFYEVYQHLPSYENQRVDFEAGGNIALKCKVNSEKSVGKAAAISLVLHMALTSKSKDRPHSRKNPFMVGFPVVSYENHRDLILLNGYTIVVVDQKDKKSTDEKTERYIADVLNPGTAIDNPMVTSLFDRNAIVSVYLEGVSPPRNGFEKTKVLCGVSSLDVSTGRSVMSESYSRDEDELYAVHELYRFLLIQRPVTVIINARKVSQDYIDHLKEVLDLNRYPTVICRSDQLDPNFLKESYQEAFLAKAFGSKLPLKEGTTSIIHQLDMELFHYGRVSYVILLQYCYSHRDVLIERLDRPEVGWTDEQKYLIPTHNAMEQLDIYSGRAPLENNNVVKDLVGVLDFTSTTMGSRHLKRRLLSPITDPDSIERTHNAVQELVEDAELLHRTDELLKRLPDIERLHRKLEIRRITPRELVSLIKSHLIIQEIYVTLYQACFNESRPRFALRELFLSHDCVTEFNDALKDIWATLDLEALEKVKFTQRGVSQKIEAKRSFVHPGQYPEIDQIQNNLEQFQNWLNAVCDHLNSVVSGTRGKRIEPTYERSKGGEDEEDGEESKGLSVAIYTTPTRATMIRRAPHSQLCGSLEFHEMRAKSKTAITSEVLRQVFYGIEVTQSLLEQRLVDVYQEIVAKMSKRTYFISLIKFVTQLDFVKSGAQVALKHNYHKPEIDRTPGPSYCDARELRHPLVERIIRTEYVPNDLSLGHEGPLGLLLFGVNSTGKTCFAKAYMLVVMMAQAGFWVPGWIKLRPFKRVITRLSGNDDMKAGKSSYIVEMSELRTVLRNGDQYSLVVGDELCRGTESLSGTSLVMAGIEFMMQRKIKFIFSTHMHHLPDEELVKTFVLSGQLRVAHLSVTYDEITQQLVYGRKIAEGAGSSRYGLEVCKSLGMPSDFLDRANEIRRGLEGKPVMFHSTKKSKWNPQLYVDRCALCGGNQNLHTHHIREQREADERGFIGPLHKDSVANLVILCQRCHQSLHATGAKLELEQTLQGVSLIHK